MNIHLLVTKIPKDTSSKSYEVISLFEETAKRLGHILYPIEVSSCKMLFDKKPKLLINNKKPAVDLLLTRPGAASAQLPIQASIIRQFELSGIMTINSYESTVIAKNKILMLQMLAKARVPIPKTYVVTSSQYVPEIMDNIGSFPVIIKSAIGLGGIGVAIVESKRGLRSVIEMMTDSEEPTPLIIQQYIRESSGKDIRVFVVGGKIIAAMERIATKKGEFRSNFSIGGKVRIASLSDEEKKLAKKAAAALNLDISGVDIIRSKEGPKILEVNCNPGVHGITQATGVNVVESIIKYAVKKYQKNQESPKKKK
jgi:ribosomal protein S6--L-glutamate ligase